MAITFPSMTSTTGGTKTTSGLYTFHTFTTTDNFVIESGVTADVLVVAGGGGGGGFGGGAGGGAGGLIYKPSHTFSTGTYLVTVGSGGPGGLANPGQGTQGQGTVGSDSSITTLFVAKGGGGGAGARRGTAGGNGGSGGGGSTDDRAFFSHGSATQSSQSGDSGTYGFGFNGGDTLGYYSGGGGGGAGAVGTTTLGPGGGAGYPPSVYGHGGIGKLISGFESWGTNSSNTFTGSLGYFAGGGGGGLGGGSFGGPGGGGSGVGIGLNGTANTGGGGGGDSQNGDGGNGGKGIVILRILTSSLQVNTYTDSNSVTWTYNGTAWQRPRGTLGPTGPSGPTGNGVNDVPRITSRLGNVSNASGGTITLTGTDFVSGCTVYIGTTAATTTTVDSSTQITAVIPSGIASGTYFIYIYNPDGSSGFLPNGLTIPVRSGSLSFNGSTNYLEITDSSIINFSSSSNYTVEAWIYPTVALPSGYSQIIAGSGYGFTMGFLKSIPVFPNGVIYITNNSAGFAHGGTPTLNTWNHIAYVNIASTGSSVYLNGVQTGTDSAYSFPAANTFIGANYDGSQKVTGYISNLRVVKGTAVYTGTSFTVPTSPLTAISGTQLLLNTTYDSNYLKDNSSNNFTITNYGSVPSSALTPFGS